ncbi:ABC transporter permease [Citreimonas salinaria]|uniref:Putative spermidine/putrescine transport system permease protein n=1 Tax=Citreimonas salinaria TaxID=321339 RepID=A0A1H3JGQ2_9RHOB|nr:ABC transporter permease [Citreimonas salinaria]SDY39111.1 putative spermidine/putrescine transport system permease protein [Citreimonas salinaria]
MSDATSNANTIDAPTPEKGIAAAEAKNNPVLAADGTPLKKSLRRALRAQKLRALMLIAPLLIFVLVTFIAPILDMLFRSIENQIVSDTLPRTTSQLSEWDPATDELPPEAVYEAFYYDLFAAVEARQHTRLGQRLNYENTGVSSLFRGSGRDLDDFREDQVEYIEDFSPEWEDAGYWLSLMSGEGGEDFLDTRRDAILALIRESKRSPLGDLWCATIATCATAPEDIDIGYTPSAEVIDLLPRTSEAYADFALITVLEEEDSIAEEEPWEAVYVALAQDLAETPESELAAFSGPQAQALVDLKAGLADVEAQSFRDLFAQSDDDWVTPSPWRTIQTYAPAYTTGYFLNAADMQKTPDGPEFRPENERIYGLLLQRTMFLSLTITFSCILLGYPIAYLLSNLPMRTANLLMILVLLPFWTSLLVRTSAWKVMLQQQGVINDVLVWLGLVGDGSRLVMINNQFGTIVAMTHILLPFMILPMYSVMSTIPPSYVRAAKSLGATNWTTFWRVYFPQSVPGIGAGSILVFILSIGYYITPEIVGGTTGTFISNRIAYHISSSLNWGLAAALGSILLVVVLALYWAYDRIVGIDNVKLGG